MYHFYSNLKVGLVQSSYCSDGEVVTFGSETQAWRLWHHHGGHDHHTVCRASVPVRTWPREYLQRTVPFGHPSAQRPCAEGWRVHGQRRAKRKDHETNPQEPHGPLGRGPGAGSHGPICQKARHSTQTTAGQEASAPSTAYPETALPRRHFCLIKEAGP